MNSKLQIGGLLLIPLMLYAAGALTGRLAAKVVKKADAAPATLIDAVLSGQDDVVMQHILKGEDPGQAVILRRKVLHWREGDIVTPVLVAIAKGRPRTVEVMLRNTDRLHEAPNDRALCVAARYRHSNVARLLTQVKGRGFSCEGP